MPTRMPTAEVLAGLCELVGVGGGPNGSGAFVLLHFAGLSVYSGNLPE